MAEANVYRVAVRHNVVVSVTRVAEAAEVQVPETKLEVSTQLARNHRLNGCIDGDYYFDDPDVAKYFAVLSLDFVKRLIEQTIEDLEGRTFAPEVDWHNRHCPAP